MANEILIIGVGSAGVIAADKMDLPNSKKLFVDADFRQLKTHGIRTMCNYVPLTFAPDYR